jgi:hypothetical protein
MFSGILDIIEQISYGPTSIIYRDVNIGLRVLRIDPYNYYLINTKGKIYILLTACDGGSRAIVVNSSGSKTVCVNITSTNIERILNSNSKKMVLSTKVESMRLETLLNLSIQNRLMSID